MKFILLILLLLASCKSTIDPEPDTFLEEAFSIAVEDEELVPENLDSINNVTAYLQSKIN